MRPAPPPYPRGSSERAGSRSIRTSASAPHGRRRESREYHSVKLDDPSFPAPIYASVVDTQTKNEFSLIIFPPRRRVIRPNTEPRRKRRASPRSGTTLLGAPYRVQHATL
ncbi:DUF736 family protein [Mesorhizobium sp. M0027]|uniref:DUF736 family protein n=1 Tax=Mesorhizobium sp. M0027 TaxID=2956848 RepID=UPI0033395951